MENDALRSGLIFKLKPRDLERVRSPPVVKFNVPAINKPSAIDPTRDVVRQSFLEIYRQTPVPKSAAVKRPDTAQTASSSATSGVPQVNRGKVTYGSQPNFDALEDDMQNGYDDYDAEQSTVVPSPRIDEPASSNYRGNNNEPAAVHVSVTKRSGSNGSSTEHRHNPNPVSTSPRLQVQRAVTPASVAQPQQRSVSAHPRGGFSRAQATDSLFLLAAAPRPQSAPRPTSTQSQSIPPVRSTVAVSGGSRGVTGKERGGAGASGRAAPATHAAPQHRLLSPQLNRETSRTTTVQAAPANAGAPVPKKRGKPSKQSVSDEIKPRPAKAARKPMGKPNSRGCNVDEGDGNSGASGSDAADSSSESQHAGDGVDSGSDDTSTDEERGTRTRGNKGSKSNGKVVTTRSGRESVPKKVIPLGIEQGKHLHKVVDAN
jgi:hypothetical protein